MVDMINFPENSLLFKKPDKKNFKYKAYNFDTLKKKETSAGL